MTTTQTVKPLSLDTFDVSNVVIASKYYDMPEYGFRSVNMSYNRDDTTHDKFDVKITGNIVKIFEPKGKSKKYAALLKVSDQTSIDLLSQIDDSISKPVLDSKSTIFDGLKIGRTNMITKVTSEEDVLKYRAKPLLDYNDKYQSYSLGFEFFSDKCTIVHSGDVAQEVRDADTILGKLPQHSEVTMVIQISKISVNMSKCKWNAKATAVHIHCSGVGEGSGNSGSITGNDIDDIDTSKITLDELKTNDYNGKFVPVKYDGRSLSLKLEDVEARFVKTVNEEDGKLRFSLAVDLTEHRKKFEEIDDHILKTLFDNQKDYFSRKDIDDDEELFANNFRGSLKEDDKGGKFTFWVSIYDQNKDKDGNELDVPEFPQKFYSRDEDGKLVEMETDDIHSSVFGSTDAIKANLSVYIRFIWLGNKKSVKWYLGRAQVNPTQSVSYDLELEDTQVARDEEVDEFDGPADDDETAVVSADEVSDEED